MSFSAASCRGRDPRLPDRLARVRGLSPRPRSRWSGGHGPGLQSDLDALVAGGAPGAILLVRGQHGTKRLTAGVAEIATGRPMHPGDRYRIASLAKTYVGNCRPPARRRAQAAVERQRREWLPGLVPNGENIRSASCSAIQAGSSTSRTSRGSSSPISAAIWASTGARSSALRLAISHPPLYPPGETTQSTYSNTNYTFSG